MMYILYVLFIFVIVGVSVIQNSVRLQTKTDQSLYTEDISNANLPKEIINRSIDEIPSCQSGMNQQLN